MVLHKIVRSSTIILTCTVSLWIWVKILTDDFSRKFNFLNWIHLVNVTMSHWRTVTVHVLWTNVLFCTYFLKKYSIIHFLIKSSDKITDLGLSHQKKLKKWAFEVLFGLIKKIGCRLFRKFRNLALTLSRLSPFGRNIV